MGLAMEMEEEGEAPAPTAVVRARERGVEIYPPSRYYFGARDAATARGESAADRALRLKANFAAHGLRTCVHGVLLVELFDHPHVLLLQVRNSSFILPGGRLRPGEQDVEGLKRSAVRSLRSSHHYRQNFHRFRLGYWLDWGVHWNVVEI